MSKHSILGLTPDGTVCPLCGVGPQVFQETGTENVVECRRCGLPSGVDLAAPAGKRQPSPVANAAWLGVLRQYWTETRMKVTAPELVGSDVELAGRSKALSEWLAAHPALVNQAQAASVAPYTSVTAICVQVEGPAGQDVGRAWSLILPHEAVGAVLRLPFPADGFALGTIITIQTPIPLPGSPASEVTLQ